MAVVTPDILEETPSALSPAPAVPSAFLWAMVPWAGITAVFATVKLQCQ